MAPFHWLVGDIIKEGAAVASAPATDLPTAHIAEQELRDILTLHREWIESRGVSGQRLDLARANFEGLDLSGANLQGAILNRANFRGAELLLADLRGASLVQADLRETNVLGADFQGANLEGTSLEGAAGLHTKQLAGASLLWTVLPASISEFEGYQVAVARARQCHRLLLVMLGACALGWLRILTTHDVQLLRGTGMLPFLHLADALPISAFYFVMPIALLGLYLYFHVSLERLWERLAEQPAVFPDGQAIDRSGPWAVMRLFRARFRDWGANRANGSPLESAIPYLAAYWAVPASLVLFWARYLIMQDLRAAMLHIFLVVVGVGVATAMPRLRTNGAPATMTANGATGTAAIWLEPRKLASQLRPALRRIAVALAVGAVLALLTLGTVYGNPRESAMAHEGGAAPDLNMAKIRGLAADAFWLAGYQPYADLTESSISTAPANWSGRTEDLAQVKGAQLNNLRLHYAQGYRTFWANAHLWEADLRGAYFSESDFRGANLRQANLRSTAFDRAQLFRANLQGSNLQNANLSRADLRETDLSYAVLSGTILVDARLGGANLFSADLRGARLAHANFDKADLREANLAEADLTLADMQEAYLWSARLPGAHLRDAQLGRAILIEADLSGSDLRGTNFQGAVMRGTNLSQATLTGADLRGASGVTPAQVCSASERGGVLLDEAVAAIAAAQCGI